MSKIFEALESIGVTSKDSREVLSERTRDRRGVTVWKDRLSGVIYIDDFYCGVGDYSSGGYRQGANKASYEREQDLARRTNQYSQFYAGKDICDVGCGAGDFLRKVRFSANSVAAVELQEMHKNALNEEGIDCKINVRDHALNFDTVFAFHSLEHFDDPLGMLENMCSKIKPGGRIVIEVPHANDFLISTLESKAFLGFTLWSPHLVLHTRESLKRMLLVCGFKNISIEGVQRYPLSNHMNWLANEKPGGHKGSLSLLDTLELREAYQNALRKIDATDTIVAIAEV